MKILKSWLQDHIVETLPDDEQIINAFTLKSSEVEGVEQVKTIDLKGKEIDDTVFDLKVLPDRAHYMLSHRGVAYDLCAILNLTLKEDKAVLPEKNLDIKAKIEADVCNRYSEIRIENIQNAESPMWLRLRLESVGSRSISAIVDATNYAMFDTGQPIHAFDADKVTSPITVRFAKEGEQVEILGGKTITLKSHQAVLADSTGALDIAGVKGGKRAEVDMNTKNIILASSNFNPVSVRKTSFEVGIRNDSSKRYENEITPYLTEKGASKFLDVIEKIIPGIKIGKMTDIFNNPPKPWVVEVQHQTIEKILSNKISEKRVVEILEKLLCKVTVSSGVYSVIPPFERLDLIIAEDIIDEIGRIEGLDKIKSIVPEAKTSHAFSPEYLLSEKIKDFLVAKGFSEVITRSFSNKGDIEVAYPMASDKGFLRNNLHDGLLQTIEQGVKNAPLLGLDEIRVFEIGKIFTKQGERTSLIVGIRNIKKKMERVNDKIKVVRDELFKELGIEVNILCTVDDSGGIVSLKGKTIGMTNNIDGVLEIEIDDLVDLVKLDLDSIRIEKGSRVQLKPFSKEPFIARDIALFVSSDVNAVDVQNIIRQSLIDSAGPLLVKGPDLFDQFEKDGKKSLAFRMIFQANDRTLTDEEVNGFMDNLYLVVKEKGWQVR
jgi:phenylalanyl-tRNA synthetase beta chain